MVRTAPKQVHVAEQFEAYTQRRPNTKCIGKRELIEGITMLKLMETHSER